MLDAIERFDGYRLTPAELELDAAEIATGAAALDTESREAVFDLQQDLTVRKRFGHAAHEPDHPVLAGGGTREDQYIGRPGRA